MDVSQYLSVFMDECREHLQNLNESLLQLEANPENSSLLDQIFRSAHTLKGASATMGFNNMANLTHTMEDVLSKLRTKELTVTPEIINVLFQALDLLEVLAGSIADGKEEEVDVSEVAETLRLYISGDSGQAQKERRVNLQLRYSDAEKEELIGSLKEGNRLYHFNITMAPDCLLKGVRVFMVLREIERLGTISKSVPALKDLEDEKFDQDFVVAVISASPPEELLKTIKNVLDVQNVSFEEIPPDKIPVEKRAPAHPEERSVKASSGQTVRVDIKKLDDLMNLVAELVISRSRLEAIGSGLQSKDLEELVEQVGRLTLDLRDNVLKTRMVPVDTVFSRFPRLIRDLSKELNKQIVLEIQGGETELDRTVIDEIGDPLVHIIRNAVDHGIESAAERAKAGKPVEGTVQLSAHQEGNSVVLTITDDGRGFDVEKVKEKALKSGIVSKAKLAEMREEEILALTFLPGFSTASKVTDVSGRGVGMDVVKTKVDALSGEIRINSVFGQGTTIEIHLPLTLAIIQTLMVQLGKEIYAIPSGYIEQIISLPKNEIKNVRSQPVFMLRGDLVPLIRLQEILDVPDVLNPDLNDLDVVVLRLGDRLVGCVVDALLRQQDVVIKSLGGYLGAIKGIAGATILGDGKVALIIDIRAVA